MLDVSAPLALAGRTVLGIFAHPDDESLACGGVAEPTLAIGTDGGGELVVVEHDSSVRSWAASPHRVTCVFVDLPATRYVADVTPTAACSPSHRRP